MSDARVVRARERRAAAGADRVPLVDLGVQHREVAAEVAAGFERVMASGAFVGGPDVAAFEQEYAAFAGVAHCVGVANGTDALELALRAAGVGPGDEVIVPANTFAATAEAVVRAGARVVLADCDPEHLLVDPAAVDDRLTSATRAVIAVHLYGQVAPMERLCRLAERAGVAVVEDAAQAHGARRNGRPAGSFGLAAGTSFYPGKNLGAYGDAGAVLTGSAPVAAAVRDLRNHGGQARHEHRRLGFNSRLDTLQAVVLRSKLRRLPQWNEQRRQAARRYSELLAGCPDVVRPCTLAGNEHVWHLYVVRVPRRDRVLDQLVAAGIEAGIHYPTPLHLQGGFRHLAHEAGDFPVAEGAAGTILSLPLYPGIDEGQQHRVVAALRDALR